MKLGKILDGNDKYIAGLIETMKLIEDDLFTQEQIVKNMTEKEKNLFDELYKKYKKCSNQEEVQKLINDYSKKI